MYNTNAAKVKVNAVMKKDQIPEKNDQLANLQHSEFTLILQNICQTVSFCIVDEGFEFG